VDVKLEAGQTALTLACEGIHLDLVTILAAQSLDWGAKKTALVVATRIGRWGLAGAVLQGISNGGSEAISALAQEDVLGWSPLHYATAAQANGSRAAADWLILVRAAVGDAALEPLLDTVKQIVCSSMAARAAAGIAWPEQARGEPGSLLVVAAEQSSAKLWLGNFVSAKVGCFCPAGHRGYYELELVDAVSAYPQFGFSARNWEHTDEFCGEGVGDCAFSWGVDGERGFWWHEGQHGAYPVQWCAGDVIGLACDLSAGEQGVPNSFLVAVNGNWSMAMEEGGGGSITLPAELDGLHPAFSGAQAAMVCRLGPPFRYSPPSPDYMPMASFAAAKPLPWD